MLPVTRRDFLRSASAALPVIALPACAAQGDERTQQSARSLDPALLRALAESTLPSELDAAARDRAVVEFQQWLAGYQPVAERDHGYGTGELTYTGADPLPGWRAQLEALDLESRQRFSRGFVEIEADLRQRLVRAQLRRERAFPSSPADAQHVALGLMAWWYSRPEATDLCYRARIARETCRPLEQTGDQPSPLGNGA